MCSISHGCAGAKKDVQKQIPFLQGYDEVVIFFDNDDPGKKATEEVASILPPCLLYTSPSPRDPM